jgi:hypothetical protein
MTKGKLSPQGKPDQYFTSGADQAARMLRPMPEEFARRMLVEIADLYWMRRSRAPRYRPLVRRLSKEAILMASRLRVILDDIGVELYETSLDMPGVQTESLDPSRLCATSEFAFTRSLAVLEGIAARTLQRLPSRGRPETPEGYAKKQFVLDCRALLRISGNPAGLIKESTEAVSDASRNLGIFARKVWFFATGTKVNSGFFDAQIAQIQRDKTRTRLRSTTIT